MKRETIVIHEVGPRDGLQVEKITVPLEVKIRWIDALLESGIDAIQLGSFVHPKKVPQMADTDELFAHYMAPDRKERRATLSGLVLNERGLERALACGVEMIGMGVSASETHSRKNTGMATTEALHRIVPMAKEALSAGRKVQVSVQSAFGCGFEGPIPREKVLRIVEEYLAAGLRNLSLADTAGHAQPLQVEEIYGAIRDLDPTVDLACHFHNTYGLGLANAVAALRAGVTCFESSFGGLGGCPFTKAPSGNISTEDLVHSLQRMGYRRDLRIEKLLAVARDVGKFFGRELPSFCLKSGSIVEFEGD